MGPPIIDTDSSPEPLSTRNQAIKALCWYYAFDEAAAKNKYKQLTVEQTHQIVAEYREYIEKGGQ